MTDTPDRSIVEFIDHARSRGMDHGTIRMLLLSAGWKEKDVARAMAQHGLDLAVPSPPDVGGAREAFLYLVMFAALYTAAISAMSLVFSLINGAFPDTAVTLYAGVTAQQERQELRWGIAALVVSFPVLIGLARQLLREMRQSPDRGRSATRRWLTYLTLFVAAVAVGVDLMTLVFQLLGGELSARFVLKVVTVFTVAGGGFVYYFVSLRMPPETSGHSPLHRGVGWASTAFAAAVLVAGIVVIGSPAGERDAQYDARRIEDLRMIHDAVMRHSFGDGWKDPAVPLVQVQPLPASIGDIARDAVGVRPRITDPETGMRYAYQVSGASTFRLCGVFRTTRDDVRAPEWNHQAGLGCFDFDGQKPQR